MISLVHKPSDNDVVFANNPSTLEFLRKDIAIGQGEYASRSLVFLEASPPAHLEFLNFLWSDNEVNFVFDDLPSYHNSLRLQAYITGSSWADYIDLLCTQINGHPLFSQHYTATVGFTDAAIGIIVVKAKEKGAYFSLLLTGSTVTLDASSTNTNGLDQTSYINYSLFLSPRLTLAPFLEKKTIKGNTLEAVGVVDLENDQVHLKFHDIKDIAKNYLEPTLPHLAYAPFTMHDAVAFVDIAISEYYSDIQRRILYSDRGQIPGYSTLKVINGGLSLNQMKNENTEPYIKKFAKFLTHQPLEKMVLPDQPEWLCIYLPPDEYTINYRVVYADGSVAGKTTNWIVNHYDEIVCIPTGYQQAGLALLNPLAKIIYYEVFIENFDGTYTETRTFIIDWTHYEFKKYILCYNSLGGWDTFRCVAPSSYATKYTRAKNTYALDAQSRPDTGVFQMVINQAEKTLSLRSGWVASEEELKIFDELMLSTKAYLINPLVPNQGEVPFKQNFHSLVTVQDSVELMTDGDTLRALEFKMQLASNDINFDDSSLPKERYYDSEFTATVVFIDLSPGSNLKVVSSSSSSEIYINGQLVATDNTNYTHTGLELNKPYLIHYKGYGVNVFRLETNAPESKLTVTKIQSASVTQLRFLGFDQVSNAYLLDRVDSMHRILQFQILCNASNFDVDGFLLAFKLLKDSGKSSITTIQLQSGNTPSALGNIYKNALISSGVSVTT